MSRRSSKSDVGCTFTIAVGIFAFAILVNYWKVVVAILSIIAIVKILHLLLPVILAACEALANYAERKRIENAALPSPDHQIDWHDIDYMEGHMFEHYIAQLLRKNGFQHVEVTVASGDYGTDIIAHKNGLKYAIQCKRYSPGSRIGLKPVQEIYSGRIHYNADSAVVITNLYFSENAKILAKETGVVLWDRDKLEELIYNASIK